MTPAIVEIRVYSDRIELVNYEGTVFTYIAHDYKIEGSWVTVSCEIASTRHYLHDDYKIWYEGCVGISEES